MKDIKSVLKMGQLKMTLNLGKQYLVSCLTKTQKPDYHNHLAKKLCCSKTSAKTHLIYFYAAIGNQNHI